MNFNISKLVYLALFECWLTLKHTQRENMSSLFPDKCGDLSRSYKTIKGLHKDSKNSETTVYKPCSDQEFFLILQMDALTK